MLTPERYLAADVLLRWSSRFGSWLGDFDQVDMQPRGSHHVRHADAEQLERKMAIMCYLSVFGWLVAYRTPQARRGPLVAFHLRQMTVVQLISVAILLTQIALLPFFGWSSLVVAGVGFIVVFLLRMIGVTAAMKGLQEPLPVIGPLAQYMLPRL